MPAVFFKQIGTGDERLDEVQSLDAAARPLSRIVGTLFFSRAFKGDKDRRASVFLGDAGGDDPDDAVVPVLRGKNNDGIVRKVVLRRDLGIRLLDDLVFLFLPLTVDAAEMAGERRGGRAVLRKKELHREGCVADSSGGVDPRRDGVADIGRRDLAPRRGFRFHTGRLDQLDEARTGRVFYQGEAVADDETVFVPDGHDVRYRADGDKIAVFLRDAPYAVHHAVVRRKNRLERAEELEHDADAGQLLEGIGAVGPPGIDDRLGLGKVFMAFVVIGDDDVHAEFARDPDLRRCRYARVNRNDEAAAFLRKTAQRAFGYAVALSGTAGDEVADVRAAGGQIEIEAGRGGHAVDVVVAVDDDALLCLDGRDDAFHRAVHVLHEKRIVKLFLLLGQKGARLLGRGAPPVDEKLRRREKHAEILRDGAHRRILRHLFPCCRKIPMILILHSVSLAYI